MSEPDALESQLIFPDWPAPANIRAISTTRLGGVSHSPWHQMNLAIHVGDDPRDVQQNRDILMNMAQLPQEPMWLQQVHGCDVFDANNPVSKECDASVSRRCGEICVVMTADCLPLLMTNRQGTVVAAVHAGWKGLASGVIERAIDSMACDAKDILVWLGPAIGPNHFEVGEDVYAAFVDKNTAANSAFVSVSDGKWLCNLYRLARQCLSAYGILSVTGGDLCTYSDAERFFSYRRDGVTGRMASLIWME